MASALTLFSKPTRAWFEDVFDSPTPAQEQAWQAISKGQHSLVVAPTGSGKTLAAFLWAIDRLISSPVPEGRERRTRVLYISPLKALAVDVERNLRAPLTGITHLAQANGTDLTEVTVALRSGDTPANERQRFQRHPTDILITTPESLFLLLTSNARDVLRGVETVIVDEVHAVAGTKRGAHLAVSLERLDALLDQPAQRIGLSATVRPVETVARFLGGRHAVEVVQPAERKAIELSVVVPVEDLTSLDGPSQPQGGSDQAATPASIWPHVESRIVDLVSQHRSTIVFANSRRLAERLSARLNEVWFERHLEATTPIARAHHGSVSREQRKHIEDDLKQGVLPAVVATSSLELGIDMGAVDLVIQVEPPPSVASGLQRVGRAEHHVEGVSRGVIFPKHRGELVSAAVTVQRMREGAIEALSVPENPLDVLAQQVVAIVAMDDWTVADLAELLGRAAPYHQLPSSIFEAVLDMLAGRYPSDAFAELKPRLLWDREFDRLTARPGAQRIAILNAGTIPDRGLFGVFLAGSEGSAGRRVGELDEEMVYESRVGDVFALGATSWRIEDITHDRVIVTPAPGLAGKMPFWHGDALGRPAELGLGIGAFVRELSSQEASVATQTFEAAGLDAWASQNAVAYLAEQRQACGHLADDRTIVIERFRDEIGDWRMVVHSYLGARVNTPWSLLIGARLHEEFGVDVQVMPSDDGIVLRLPDAEDDAEQLASAVRSLVFDVETLDRLVTDALAGSALFAAKFRECAARALLLPRNRPDRRTPLWQQRQRSAQLLGVASEHAQFPIVLETMRECLQDVFDLPSLRTLMQSIHQGTTRLVEVETTQPSPFARSLLFSYVGAFLYEGDAPLAERRAQALALDSGLLAELLGQSELRELLDADAIHQVEERLQRLIPERAIRDVEDLADALRVLGPLSAEALAARGAQVAWAEELTKRRRAVAVKIAGERRWIAVEDMGRLRDALGVPPPPGIAEAFLEPVADPLQDLVLRYARTHGPFTTADLSSELGLGSAVVEPVLRRLSGAGRVLDGEFLPGGSGREWCEAEVLRQIRRRSLAILRKEVEAVPPSTFARFLPEWQHVGGGLRGVEGVLEVVEQLQGTVVPASVLEQQVLAVRVVDYAPSMLDELLTSGEVQWSGHGALPGNDGWIALATAESAPLLVPDPDPLFTAGPTHHAVLDLLSPDHALFLRSMTAALPDVAESELLEAVWDLVWAGLVTNDTLSPLRARVGGRSRGRAAPVRRRYARPGRMTRLPRPTSGTASGRWALVPPREGDPTVRTHAFSRALLDRHGIVTRGAVMQEKRPGGFAAAYRVLAAMEESGQTRRGYFVEGLGAAQFASTVAVDRLRAQADVERRAPVALALAATDPANPYGAALSWPARAEASGHLPGRKGGALVVLVDGELTLYVERGGRTMLTWTDEPDVVREASDALADAVRRGWLGRITVEQSDGAGVFDSAWAEPLQTAGFHLTPRGLRLSARV